MPQPESLDNTGNKSSQLDDDHRAALQAQGLSDEAIDGAGIYSLSGSAMAELLGWSPKPSNHRRGFVIPYNDASGATGYHRATLDAPRCRPDGSIVKMESPDGARPRAYFPPGFFEALEDAEEHYALILIVEGEVNALAAMQAGFLAIGLDGRWGWKYRRKRSEGGKSHDEARLIPDLAVIDWKERHAVTFFDSYACSKHAVPLAEARLAEVLGGSSSVVRVGRLSASGGRHATVARFLAAHGEKGSEELQKLVENAQSPAKPGDFTMLDWAHVLVDDQFTNNGVKTLRCWRSEFYLWDGRRYVKIPEQEMKARVLTWLDEYGNKEERKNPSRAIPKCAENILACMKAVCGVPFDREQPCWLGGRNNPDPSSVIGFHNGLGELVPGRTTLRIRPHTPLWFSTTVVSYSYAPKARCPQWDKFLLEVFDNDPERIDLLQRWFGLLLTSNTSHQKFLLMVGPPRAGKGVICRILQHVVGEQNCSSPSLTSLAGDFGLWSLLGKSVALFPDAHLGTRSDSVRIMETIKSIVGEDAANVNRKYLPVLQNVHLGVRFVMTVNELPQFGDSSGAMKARLSVLPFHQSFQGKEDRGLTDRLKMEAPGIANWAIEGLQQLTSEGGFNTPEESMSILENFSRLTSPITAFVQDCCELAPAKRVLCAELYGVWKEWALVSGHDPCSVALFGTRLQAAYRSISKIRPKAEGIRQYHYVGVLLNNHGKGLLKQGQERRARESAP